MGTTLSIGAATILSHPPPGWHREETGSWYQGPHTWGWYYDQTLTASYRPGPGWYVDSAGRVVFGDVPDWRPTAWTYVQDWFLAGLLGASLRWVIRFWDRVRQGWQLSPRWARPLWVLWLPGLIGGASLVVWVLVSVGNHLQPGSFDLPTNEPDTTIPAFAVWDVGPLILVLAAITVVGTLFAPWCWYVIRACFVFVRSVGRASFFVLPGEVARFDQAAKPWQNTKKTADVEISLGQLAAVLRAATLVNRLEATGDEAVVEAALADLRQAADSLEIPDGFLFGVLSTVIMPTMSYVLRIRAERLHSTAALAESVAIAEQLRRKRFTTRRPSRITAHLTSRVLAARWARSGSVADLDRAIHEAYEAGGGRRSLLPGARRLNLAELLLVRAEHFDDLEALGSADRLLRPARWRSGRLRARAHFDRSRALLLRFHLHRDDHHRDLSLVRDALSDAQRAVERTSDQSPYLSARIFQHAECLWVWSTAGGAHEPGAEPEPEPEPGARAGAAPASAPTSAPATSQARNRWREAAGLLTAPAVDRLRAARRWAQAAAEAGEWEEAWTAYRVAVDLLPRLVWRGVARDDQEWLLSAWGDLPAEAVAAALNAGDLSGAVEVFEQGRAILWSQLADLRRSYSSGSNANHETIARLDSIRALLDTAGSAPNWVARQIQRRLPLATGISDEQRTALSREYEALIAMVDPVPKPGVEELGAAAADGPVVLVNVASRRSDALVVRAGQAPQLVPLPGLRLDEVQARLRRLEVASRPVPVPVPAEQSSGDLGAVADSDSAGIARIRLNRMLAGTLEWLWDAVAAPVLEALGHTSPTSPAEQAPRVWWCPSGPLAMLPLHAAGHHAKGTGETVPDRVASSYTPTLRSLSAIRDLPAASAESRALVVAMPQTPGHAALPGAAQERRTVEKAFQGHCRVLVGSTATLAAVQSALPECTWVHFACHGTQDPDMPAAAGIVLHDGVLSARLLSEAPTMNAEFAYLSACQSATPDHRILNESAHPAALLHLHGFRQVVATLGPIPDAQASRIAEALYCRWDDLGPAALPLLAHTLRQAVLAARDERPTAPARWSPYLHIGL
ncbi:CHAT domain-containing protein [Catenulispora yoronensis]|uniref:CHAT domain-containing protein n=1 Tax=Catenulispora yoronensis TaxID=450799 RepID=UPI0031DD950E